MIPAFTSDGNLPPGIHIATLNEVENRFGYNSQRRSLFDGIRRVVNVLQHAGCTWFFLDGSFVTEKEYPNDYDACWDVTNVDPARIDPILLDFSPAGRQAQKGRYKGDLFPAQAMETNFGDAFIKFFQVDKVTGNTKGILAINLI